MVNLEIWKAVKGYEELYEVSSYGNVRSLKGHYDFNRIRLLTQHLSGRQGGALYKTVTLYNRKGGRKTYKVHRLVALAFLPNPNNLECINHKDENTSNNHVDNLEWCTKRYNIKYGTALDRAKKKRCKKVVFIKDNKIVHSFDSVIEAGKFFNAKPQNIARTARGVRGSFHGFTVKYVDNI